MGTRPDGARRATGALAPPKVHAPFLAGLRKEADAHLKPPTGPDRTEPAPPSRGSGPPPWVPSAQQHATQNWGQNSHRTAGPAVPTGHLGRGGHGWPHADSPVRRQTPPHGTHGTLGWVTCPGWEGKGAGSEPAPGHMAWAQTTMRSVGPREHAAHASAGCPQLSRARPLS